MRRPYVVNSCSSRGEAVDALLGVDDQDPLEVVDAVDRADVDAREVFDVDAGLGDDVRHARRQSTEAQLLDGGLQRSSSADFAITWSKPAVCARAEPGRVRVVREAEDRDVRIGVRDLLRLDPRDVADDEIGRVDAVGRDQVVLREQRLELSPEEHVDPRQQDRRHDGNVTPCAR